MNVPLLLLEIHTHELDQERRNGALRGEQIRIACPQHRNPTRTALLTIRQEIGTMLNHIGERLSPVPVRSTECHDLTMNA